MEAAPAAIPVNPNTAAIMATTRNMTVQRNITINFWLINTFPSRTYRLCWCSLILTPLPVFYPIICKNHTAGLFQLVIFNNNQITLPCSGKKNYSV